MKKREQSSVIEIKGLYKDYNSDGLAVHALNGIDLSIKKGEFTAIAGPSGSGKTTLLNIIGGIDRAGRGDVQVAGKNLNGMNPRELSDLRLNSIGFIFQAYNLIPVLTAVENVEYVLLLQGADKKERRERAESILCAVGLEKELKRKPAEMSGGQQQRVAVARAMVSNPEIILADEPTANLDQSTGSALLDLMHRLNKERGITFLFSTHDSMVMKRAGRLINLRDGRIVAGKK
ncbi:MAG TPA: ABC transporter ATP-binding protein [Spirochaetota bacterium]|nr:ABC transporter ATP-binding protein [Spirochaetota bacterium]HPJ42319.1 ABC transporter ATP-binding protein [Spirochaetota bacterium]HPR37119.1 ABC transporter ATP-binding protein [Spirochaetota bacterium]